MHGGTGGGVAVGAGVFCVLMTEKGDKKLRMTEKKNKFEHREKY